MLNPIYIQSILEQNNFIVDYINGVNTGGIHVHRFSVLNNVGGKEVVTIKYVKLFGNKVDIETLNGTTILGEDMTLKLEETIRFAVAMTPDNRLPNLFNPISFTSINFPQLIECEIDEEHLESDFVNVLNPMFMKKKENLAFLAFKLPVNQHSFLISSLFKKIASVHSVEERVNDLLIKFHSFADSHMEEMSTFHKVQKELEVIGIRVDIADIAC